MSIKIISENLKSKLFLPLYYICGEEEYLKQFYYSEIKSKAVTDLPEFNVTEFNGKKFSVQDFVDSINSYPVMSDKKVVGVVDLESAFVSEKKGNELVEILKSIPDYCTVVFADTGIRNEPNKTLSAVIKKAGGVTVDCARPDASSLLRWIRRHFSSLGKSISDDDLRYFAAVAESDMLSLGNEIDKLCSYVDAQTVTRADIDRVVTRNIDANRYDIASALYDSDFGKITDIVDRLYKQGLGDTVIAGVFYKTFLDLQHASYAVASGIASAQFAADYRLNPYIAGKIMRFSGNMSREFLQKAVMLSLRLDIELKSKPYDKRDLLMNYIAQIADCRQTNG